MHQLKFSNAFIDSSFFANNSASTNTPPFGSNSVVLLNNAPALLCGGTYQTGSLLALRVLRTLPKFKLINKALLGAVALCMSQVVSAQEISPYFTTWDTWGGTLSQAKIAAGMDSAVLAFAITNGACSFDAGFLGKLSDARNYIALGGRLTISFGGAGGVYAETACTNENQLFSLIEKLMLDSGTKRLDFDVEGNQLKDAVTSARRARVLARLQAKYPDMTVSFTLPGGFQGLDANSRNLLTSAIAAGVRIDMVNVMTMDFGAGATAYVTPSTMGQAVIVTLNAATNQVAAMFPSKSQSQVRAIMGVTPMIGQNDDGVIFTLNDAQTVANYVKINGYGRIYYWAFQRDRAQATGNLADLNYSGVAQTDFNFHKIFKTAAGAVVPTPTPTPTPTTSVSAWVQGKQYPAGSIVSYAGKNYIATYANPGYSPTISTYFWSVYLSNVTPSPTPSPTPAPTVTASAWVGGKQYAAGSIVSYSGKNYIAKFANPGYDPIVSTYFWSLYAYNVTPTPTPNPVASASPWVGGKQYAAGSVVSYSGKNYIAKYANPGYDPIISTYFWASYAG